MDKDNDNNVSNTSDYNEIGKKGFKEGNPGRPKGAKNKFSIAVLEEAIAAEEGLSEKEGGVGIFQQFVRMAYREPSVMIALMKKFIPDRTHSEIENPEPIKIIIEDADKIDKDASKKSKKDKGI
jgi:hypothetical protein